MFQLIKHLKNKGIKIDAVGVQAHWHYEKDNYGARYISEKDSNGNYLPYEHSEFSIVNGVEVETKKTFFQIFEETVAWYKSLGVEYYITEMDFGIGGNDPLFIPDNSRVNTDADFDNEDFYEKQGWVARYFMESAKKAGVELISTWGMRDESMGTWRGRQRAWILRKDGSRKPIYQQYYNALK